MLLIKRGLPPYVGTWAPPGGYVEANESLQAAAAREVAEEAGVLIDPTQLLPHAIGSEPTINQVYYGFLGVLDRMQVLKSSAPEALDARWFTVDEYPENDMWYPAARFDYKQLFQQMRSGHFHFYQWTGPEVRLLGPFSAVE
jgi:ADP-ribose pyrophosphatase YjhB (NUDIX family)